MSADLHLRALTDRAHAPMLRDFGRGNVPEWEALLALNDSTSPDVEQLREEAWDAISDRDEQLEQMATQLGIWDGPNVWLGQVSWAKASWMGEPGDWRRWVPRVVEAIQRFYDARDGIVEMTPSVRSAITTAYNLPHESWFESPTYGGRGIAKARDVKKWCDMHMGDLTFVWSE